MLKWLIDRLTPCRHLRELAAAQRYEIQFLRGRLKGAEDAIGIYRITNSRLNEELKAAEVRLDARIAKYGA